MFKNSRQKDNALLLLEWETTFEALCLVTELTHKARTH